MLGGRDFRETIQKALDKLHEDLSVNIDKNNSDRIHAIEASSCMRLAYYDRRDPILPDNMSKISALLSNGMRHALKSVRGEYRVDSLILEADADMLIADDYVLRFEVVPALPEVPHPRHLLYVNACLFVLKKDEGFLIYMTADGRTVEFSTDRKSTRLNSSHRL